MIVIVATTVLFSVFGVLIYVMYLLSDTHDKVVEIHKWLKDYDK